LYGLAFAELFLAQLGIRPLETFGLSYRVALVVTAGATVPGAKIHALKSPNASRGTSQLVFVDLKLIAMNTSEAVDIELEYRHRRFAFESFFHIIHPESSDSDCC
jgi:hypothetical protein